MKIRKATVFDAMGSYRLLETEKDRGFSAGDFKGACRHPDAIYFVAEGDKQIVGYSIGFICPTKRSECMLAETRVKESERGKGTGSKLVDAFCKEAFSRGARIVYAEIKDKDCKFYAKNKFKKSNEWIEVARIPE